MSVYEHDTFIEWWFKGHTYGILEGCSDRSDK